jgi:hypothetical protein
MGVDVGVKVKVFFFTLLPPTLHAVASAVLSTHARTVPCTAHSVQCMARSFRTYEVKKKKKARHKVVLAESEAHVPRNGREIMPKITGDVQREGMRGCVRAIHMRPILERAADGDAKQAHTSVQGSAQAALTGHQFHHRTPSRSSITSPWHARQPTPFLLRCTPSPGGRLYMKLLDKLTD